MINDYKTNYGKIGKQSVHDSSLFDKDYKEYRREWDENPKNYIVSNFPLNIDLEVTNACNLRCPHCARTQKNWGGDDIGYIERVIVEKVIDEINKEKGYCMKFSLRGEPLLHKELLYFLELAKNSKLLDFYFNTNGVLLSKEFSQAIIDLQIPRVSISVGGWDDKSFSECQVGANLKTVITNIEGLKMLRDKAGLVLPKIRIQAVAQDDLNKHIDEFKSIWEPLADEIGLIDFREETGAKDYTGKTSSSFCCNFLWQRLVVLWDGSVYPCLFHGVKDNRSLYLGNIKDKSLKEIWNGDALNNLRILHKDGLSHCNDGCNGCSYRFSMIKNSTKD